MKAIIATPPWLVGDLYAPVAATYRYHSQVTHMRGVRFRILLAGGVQDMRFELAGCQKLNLAGSRRQALRQRMALLKSRRSLVRQGRQARRLPPSLRSKRILPGTRLARQTPAQVFRRGSILQRTPLFRQPRVLLLRARSLAL